jgi:hypothetical protein
MGDCNCTKKLFQTIQPVLSSEYLWVQPNLLKGSVTITAGPWDKSSVCPEDLGTRERAAKTAAAARRWREYSRQGVDHRGIRNLPSKSKAEDEKDSKKTTALKWHRCYCVSSSGALLGFSSLPLTLACHLGNLYLAKNCTWLYWNWMCAWHKYICYLLAGLKTAF